MAGDDIAAAMAEMDEGKARFLECSEGMGAALESLRSSADALFGSWQGTGSANYRAACSSVEDAFCVSGKNFLDLSTKIGASAQAFAESDSLSASGIEARLGGSL